MHTDRRKFYTYHKEFVPPTNTLQTKTREALDDVLYHLIEQLGKAVARVVEAAPPPKNTVFPDDAYRVLATLPGDDTDFARAKVAERERCDQVKDGGRKNCNRTNDLGLTYPVKTETKDVKKPGIEDPFKRAVVTELQRDIRIHRDVYIIISATLQNTMRDIIHAAAQEATDRRSNKSSKPRISEDDLKSSLVDSKWSGFAVPEVEGKDACQKSE